MEPKKIFTNKSFCALPWTGFELEPNGDVKNCIISTTKIGNINENEIEEILHGVKNLELKKEMILDARPKNCSGCHLQEHNRKDPLSISSRLYYNKELTPCTDKSLYDDIRNFSLHHVDIRWNNKCNQACVYCGPKYSSKWANELGQSIEINQKAIDKVKNFIYDNIKNLKNVYLAGGEPLLMNENKEFLELLLNRNPNVNIRVNTNLSSTKTGVFDLLCKFKNVHWTISVETMEEQYEYVRYHGSWKNFLANLNYIRKIDHKITFNMLYFILNYKSLFSTVEYFKREGFHQNSFVIGPLYSPDHLNVLNLSEKILNNLKTKFSLEITNSSFYLKNSYENILEYISNTPWKKNINNFHDKMEILDKRRKQLWKKAFPELYNELKDV